jgi:hypothetical protein
MSIAANLCGEVALGAGMPFQRHNPH